MNYLLDTNTCIYIINKKPASVMKRIQSKRPDQVAIASITVAELEYGVARSKFPERNRAALTEFLVPFTILDFDPAAASHYGVIRASLEKRGKPIGPIDLLLAAQACAQNLILVTNNLKEFQRVEGLRAENWV